jgi:hypothetical protein
MNYLDFTAEESALIAIYADRTRAGTLAEITAALPHMGADMTDLAARSAAKLAEMTDGEFAETTFDLADDIEPDDAA